MTGDDMQNLIAREQHITQARVHWANINNLGGMMMQEIIAFGQELTEIKSQTAHGEWESTLRAEFGIGRAQATKYMAIAADPPALSNVYRNKHLPIDTVYKLLSAPEVDQALAERVEAGETFTKAEVEAEIRKAREEEIDKHARTKANAKRDREALKAREQAAAEQDGAIGQYAQEVTQLRESLAEAQAKLDAAETGALAVAPRIVTRADPEMESRLQELERERQRWEQERKELAHRLDLRDAQLNDSTKKLAEAIGTAAKHSSPQLVIEQFLNSTWLAGTERDLKAVAEIVRRHPGLGDHPGLQYRLRSLADLVDGARGAIEMQGVGMLVDA